MNAKLTLTALIAGTFILGCGITDAGPVVVQVLGIDLAPSRFSLVTQQSADVALNVTTSRPDDGAAAGTLNWRTTGGVVTNNYIVAGVRHLTYQSPSAAGNYMLIVATATGAPADTAHFSVTLTAVPVHAVSIAPASYTFAVGDTSRLRATLTDSTGNVVVGRAIDWVSSDGGVATVIATGQIRAIGVGSATITATSEGKSGTATLTVTSAPNP